MTITFENIGKKYNREWIFRNIDITLDSKDAYAITGGNGSGKSTFLQLISGYSIASEGNLTYNLENKKIKQDNLYNYISISAPSIALYEELKLNEVIDLHFKFKKSLINKKEIINALALERVNNKELKYFSSGMKQRVKLGLAILTDSPLLLLDEPLSNLDRKASDWYLEMIEKYKKNRLIVVCSNQIEREYSFCNQHINIEDFKK